MKEGNFCITRQSIIDVVHADCVSSAEIRDIIMKKESVPEDVRLKILFFVEEKLIKGAPVISNFKVGDFVKDQMKKEFENDVQFIKILTEIKEKSTLVIKRGELLN